MLRSAAIASSRAVLRLVAVSSRPSNLLRPISNADPAITQRLLLPINSMPRFSIDFSRNYAARRKVDYEDDDEEDDDEELDEMEGDLDSDDLDDDDDFDEEDDDDEDLDDYGKPRY